MKKTILYSLITIFFIAMGFSSCSDASIQGIRGANRQPFLGNLVNEGTIPSIT